MPSMRCLMTAGPALERDQVAGFNCLSGNTFVTTLEYGIVPIKELVGKQVHIVDGNGNWIEAPCRSYGYQKTATIYFKTSGKGSFQVSSTLNHRWIMKDGTIKLTSQLVSGDRLSSVKMPERIKINENSDDYIKGVQHGIIFGDGTSHYKNKNNLQGSSLKEIFVEKTCNKFHIRLCGNKTQLSPYFDGYSVTYPSCYSGDARLTINDRAIDLKSLPDFDGVNNDYLTGFIRGWIATDGSGSSISGTKENIQWLLNNGPRLGFVPQNWSFDTELKETNYGKRNYLMGRIYFDRRWINESDLLLEKHKNNFLSIDYNKSPGFGMIEKVEMNDEVEEVFCFEVPTTHSFLLTKNLLTGNCSYLAIDHPRAFDEILYLLMCFSPETEVKTKCGNKKISELTIDDEVLSYNEKDNKFEYIKPSQVVETPSVSREKIELTLEDGSVINCTSDHRFLTENRGWVEAKDLTEDDEIKNYNEII